MLNHLFYFHTMFVPPPSTVQDPSSPEHATVENLLCSDLSSSSYSCRDNIECKEVSSDAVPCAAPDKGSIQEASSVGKTSSLDHPLLRRSERNQNVVRQVRFWEEGKEKGDDWFELQWLGSKEITFQLRKNFPQTVQWGQLLDRKSDTAGSLGEANGQGWR